VGTEATGLLIARDEANVDERAFPTTIWSEVRRGGGGSAGRDPALAGLAHRYQAPAEAYLRAALGLPRERAHELFQEFFAWMLASDFLVKAEAERGRFRAFLKVALKRFATDELRKERAVKRGGALRSVSLDGEEAPEVLDRATPTPDEALDTAWRAALVEAAFERTRLALERSERGLAFAVFRDYYFAAGPEPDYRALATRHGITTTDVSNFLQRTKYAYREHLRALVLDTVANPQDLGDELAWLVEERE
jgi:RNA polymerase sigma-70 factor (ECF subfamily)